MYVVIGGAGNLGEIFSEYLITTYDAQLVWIGRRTKNQEILDKIERLGRLGRVPAYYSADAGNHAALAHVWGLIENEYDHVNGVVHAAAVIAGSDVEHMTEDRFAAVLASKVDTCVRIGQVCASRPLDFMLFFSSIQGYTTDPRQSNYAAATAFTDAYAEWLRRRESFAVKVVNWGYWGNSGLLAHARSFHNWMDRAGMGSIEPMAAMRSLEGLLAGSFDQLVFVETTKPGAMRAVAFDELIFNQRESVPVPTNSTLIGNSVQMPMTAIAPKTAAADFDAALLRVLFLTFRSMGMFGLAGGCSASELRDWKSRVGWHTLYDRWLECTLRMLSEAGCIERRSGGIAVVETEVGCYERAWSDWHKMKQRASDDLQLISVVSLVDTTLGALPDILTGRKRATDVLFASNASEHMHAIYKSPVMNYFHQVLAEVLGACVRERIQLDPGVKLRILEVGAGTGATSAHVLQRLLEHRVNIGEFCYTDISKAFVMHGKQAFQAEYPFLTCRTFDVERPVSVQSIETGAYDIVLAANSLHATRNIRNTLRNCKALLKSNGVLLLSEALGQSLLVHLCFGLLEGWWRFEDEALRLPGSPGLAADTWRHVLDSEGFVPVRFPAESAHVFGQQIIVAVSDGTVRQCTLGPKEPDIALNAPVAGAGLPDRRMSRGSADSMGPLPSSSNGAAAPAGDVDIVVKSEVESGVRGLVMQTVSRALQLEESRIEMDVPFADYGLDSILGVRAIETLNHLMAIELTSTDLFDYSTVDRLTQHIVAAHQPQFVKLRSGEREAASSPTEFVMFDRNGDGACEISKASESSRTPVAVGSRESDASATFEGIAIVGIGARYSNCADGRQLWDQLARGKDLTAPVSRWKLPDRLSGGGSCGYGSFVDQVDCFDPLFFNISGIESKYMDPHQRLFLEECWKALEDAGYAGAAVEGARCGVYAGFSGSDYQQLGMGEGPAQSMWGNHGAIVSARISYYLNLKGPAVTIDTACSSSLVATHLACQALRSRETDMALVGGVFLQSTPGFFLALNRTGMLSPTSRCRPFDDAADGFVPGEGVGVLVLKRLSDALRDGDGVRAVILGSGINQDGATNGITAPSALSQEQLEREVYERYGIDPEGIQMVEAHGTGTKLGDPIEFQALSKAFRCYTQKRHYCAIGSIKSNIGHTTAAAGVAGVIKCVLSLQHRQIPPSLNFEKGNTHIDFENSAFYVNTSLRDWEVEAGRKRRAAVSSFGISGTNAHLVLEEAPPQERQHVQRAGYLVVLSARTAEQLTEQAQRLRSRCEADAGLDCGNISYTLLLGRKHLRHRLACIVRDIPELVEGLRKWLQSGKAAHVYSGVLSEKDGREQSGLKRYGNQCIKECGSAPVEGYLERLSAVADLYVQGYKLEFEGLFAQGGYSRISLPTYPFARERYWVEVSPRGAVGVEGVRGEVLHPLLHRNSSDLQEQRFTTQLQGDEFYLRDHVVAGHRVMPGVAYLEMARAAVERSVGSNQVVVELRDVVWLRPLIVSEAKEVCIAVEEQTPGEVTFKIYSLEANELDASSERILHAQGAARCEPRDQRTQVMSPEWDVAHLRAGCQREMPIAQCYALYNSLGVHHGPALRGLASLHGNDRADSRYVLAQLKVPECVSHESERYELHPSMLDSALQAALALAGPNGEGTGGPLLPYALEALRVYAPTPQAGWACVRGVAHQGTSGLQKVDVDVCDETGHVCVQFCGLASRLLEGKPSDGEAGVGVVLLKSTWERQPAPMQGHESPAERWVFVEEEFAAELSELERRDSAVRGEVLGRADAGDPATLTRAWQQVFGRVREILRAGPAYPVSVQVVIASGEDNGASSLVGAISGLLKTAKQENTRLVGQVIECQPGERAPPLSQLLTENLHASAIQESHVRYMSGVREVRRLRELAPGMGGSVPPWRNGGVYWITGGAGGIGLIFAHEIAKCASGVRLVLTGRTALDSRRAEQLERIRAQGAQIEYWEADVRDERAVQSCVQRICSQYGELHGVVHAAGMIRDNYIVKKTAEEFAEVLGAKVDGTVYLDNATRECPLEFLVLCSSMASAVGNPAQSDYATANTFLDEYARYRNALVAQGLRQGRTLSVNWPLWAAGGMTIDEPTYEAMRRHGSMAMPTEDGIKALYQAWGTGEAQVGVLAGKVQQLRRMVNAAPITDSRASSQLLAEPTRNPRPAKAQAAAAVGTNPSLVREKLRAALVNQIAAQLHVKQEDIELSAEFSEFGFDSISLTEFSNSLNQVYGLQLNPTIFFEYPTVATLVDHLVSRHMETLSDKLVPRSGRQDDTGTLETGAVSVPARKVSPSPDSSRAGASTDREVRPARSELRAGKIPPTESRRATFDPIAIVGISGRFPGARDPRVLWANLASGVDSIELIPGARWDWRAFYGDTLHDGNKTNVKWGGFIEGLEQFDCLFFGLSPREAQRMDPHHRLLMQYCWSAIEDGGHSPSSLAGTRTGIFVGMITSSYGELIALTGETALEGSSAMSIVPSVGPNRMSFLLDVHGPSEPVDTACSSALVAVHRAVRAIQAGDCDMALMGVSGTILTPWAHIMYSKAGMLSEDGRCKAFSSNANGYVRSEGVGMLFLRPLAAAERDGDHIYGLVKASAENHGGRSNSLTAPNPKAQAELIKAAYREGNIDPRTINCIEAHGTGTVLGDPIEINGLKSAFADLYAERHLTPDQVVPRSCAISSVKSNIGHLEMAAGVAGVIKVLLQLKHRTLVKSLHCETINPYIQLEGSPFYILQEQEPWVAVRDADGHELPRRAGVSSFGFGGVNAHIVIEEYQPQAPAVTNDIPQTRVRPALMVLSAKSEERLLEYARCLLSCLEEGEYTDKDLEDIAYTLQVGRDAMQHRLAFSARSLREACEKLSSYVGQDGKCSGNCRVFIAAM